MQRVDLAVLMTCHNRRTLTLGAVSSIIAAANKAGLSFRIFVVDDGSTDGTAAALSNISPDTTIIPGDGSLYWNGGMRRAWETASATVSTRFYLWLNDDLWVEPDALVMALATYDEQEASCHGRVIVVGYTIDANGKVTYGGLQRAQGLSNIRFEQAPAEKAQCITMNGNFVLIPQQAVGDIGINDCGFRHAFGDIDYGLRASRSGYCITQIPIPVGTQERNAAYAKSVSTLTAKNFRFIFNHPKGVAWREWLLFCRRHAGRFWFVNFFIRYAKMIRSA